jgi:hypothetical protein
MAHLHSTREVVLTVHVSGCDHDGIDPLRVGDIED